MNSVIFKLVPFCGQETHPDNGNAFYVNNGRGGIVGIRVYPDGRKLSINAYATTSENNKNRYDAVRKQRYLRFRDAWGFHMPILASHAAYIAWREKPIPEGMTIDHIDGCVTNNDFRNLRCISLSINVRDGGFLRKLKNKGFEPSRIQRAYLLRYFERMAELKPAISESLYNHLTRNDLKHVLYDGPWNVNVFCEYLKQQKKSCQTILKN